MVVRPITMECRHHHYRSSGCRTNAYHSSISQPSYLLLTPSTASFRPNREHRIAQDRYCRLCTQGSTRNGWYARNRSDAGPDSKERNETNSRSICPLGEAAHGSGRHGAGGYFHEALLHVRTSEAVHDSSFFAEHLVHPSNAYSVLLPPDAMQYITHYISEMNCSIESLFSPGWSPPCRPSNVW